MTHRRNRLASASLVALALAFVGCAEAVDDTTDASHVHADARAAGDGSVVTHGDASATADGAAVVQGSCFGQDPTDAGRPECICAQGMSASCYPGAADRAGVGECRVGVAQCSATGEFGVWGACVGAVGPSAELCDGLDNDCDGVVDNDCTCAPDATGRTNNCASDAGDPGQPDVLIGLIPDASGPVMPSPPSPAGGPALHVRITWDNNATDVDLHLLHPTAPNWWDPNLDCDWERLHPIWDGVASASPTLDHDDIGGGGPENTRIDAPLVGYTYRVGVHRYSGPATTVTVQIDCGGTVIATYTRMLHNVASSTGDEAFWRVADVSIAADHCGVTPLNTVIDTSASYHTR